MLRHQVPKGVERVSARRRMNPCTFTRMTIQMTCPIWPIGAYQQAKAFILMITVKKQQHKVKVVNSYAQNKLQYIIEFAWESNNASPTYSLRAPFCSLYLRLYLPEFLSSILQPLGPRSYWQRSLVLDSIKKKSLSCKKVDRHSSFATTQCNTITNCRGSRTFQTPKITVLETCEPTYPWTWLKHTQDLDLSQLSKRKKRSL